MTDNETLIERTHELAREASRRGDEPFGALLIRDGTVVAEAGNAVVTETDLTAHAETRLLRQAWADLGPEAVSESVLYTSTEPCAMCAGAAMNAGIDTVVYSVAARTVREDGGRAGEALDVLSRAGIDAIGPVLESEGLAVHREHNRRSG